MLPTPSSHNQYVAQEGIASRNRPSPEATTQAFAMPLSEKYFRRSRIPGGRFRAAVAAAAGPVRTIPMQRGRGAPALSGPRQIGNYPSAARSPQLRLIDFFNGRRGVALTGATLAPVHHFRLETAAYRDRENRDER